MTVGPVPQLVNVFVPTLARSDAVSDQARHHARLLRRWGYEARLVAETWDASSADDAVPLGQALEAPDGAAWIVHYSIWSEGLRDLMRQPARARVFVYHNVTPPELLPRGPVADRCLQARRALPELAEGWDLVLTYSTYSAAELRRAGFRDIEVIPLLLPAPAPPAAAPRDHSVLFVGRIAPSKGLADLVKAFALLRLLHVPDATLDLVGSAAGWEPYAAGLQNLVDRIGGGGVMFHGMVTDAERDARYTRCGVMCLMSWHEGFCAPLIEAMRAGAPVVAVEAGAVAETLGAGGLLLPHHDPRLAAEALAEVLKNPNLRAQLRSASRAAVARADPGAVEGLLHRTLGAALGGGV